MALPADDLDALEGERIVDDAVCLTGSFRFRLRSAVTGGGELDVLPRTRLELQGADFPAVELNPLPVLGTRVPEIEGELRISG